MIAVLRETPLNRYTLNTLSAILDALGVDWAAAATAGELADRLAAEARRGRRSLALYSFMTPHLADVRAEVARVRSRAPATLFLAGGAHPTADPEGTLALGFDHVFAGEVETSLPAFLAAGAAGPPLIGDPGGGPPDLDRFPAFGRGRWGPVELTRGCRYRCAFCGVGGRIVRHRSVGSVLEAAEALRRMGRPKISFVTPDALSYGGDLTALDELLSGLRARGMRPVLGTFPSEVRPDRVTPEAVSLLARHCANRTLVIGGQSGSDAVLERLRRGHTVADVEQAARAARTAGFTPHVDLIFGLPDESSEQQAATVALARRLRRDAGARIHAHYFHPLPGTPFWGRRPAPLAGPAREFLSGLRGAGVEDGCWEAQERWAWQIVEWGERGWIRAPSPGDRSDG